MQRSLILALGLALALVAAGLAGCSAGATISPGVEGVRINSQQEGIWVNGQGKVSVTPDIVTLRLGIEAQEASVASAQRKAAEAMDRVMTALTNNGVAKKDIQTRFFNIQKVTRWDGKNQQEIIIGYRVTNMVTAKIRNIDKAGAIIDAVAEAGGDLTRVDSIGFSVEDPAPYHKQAREKAVADARAKAEQMAKLAGVTLGRPTYISESAYIPSPVYQARMAEAAPAPPTPISPGELEISLSVQIVYAILK